MSGTVRSSDALGGGSRGGSAGGDVGFGEYASTRSAGGLGRSVSSGMGGLGGALTLKPAVGPVCPNLRYLDLHQCTGLDLTSSADLWTMFCDRPASAPVAAVNIPPAGKMVLGEDDEGDGDPAGKSKNGAFSITVGCPRQHLLVKCVAPKDGMRCDVSLTTLMKGEQMYGCSGCNFYVSRRALRTYTFDPAFLPICWPSKEQADEFARTSCPDPRILEECTRRGVHTKAQRAFRRALSAKIAFEKEEARRGLPTSRWHCGVPDPLPSGKHIPPKEEPPPPPTAWMEADPFTKEELDDSVGRMKEEPLSDVLMFRKALDLGLMGHLGEMKFPCTNGCGQLFSVEELKTHEEEECVERMVPCAVQGNYKQLVRFKHLEAHKAVYDELQAALQTWNVPRLKRAIREAKSKDGCQLTTDVMAVADQLCWLLEMKVQTVIRSGVLARGNVGVDFDKCEIKIEKEIPFASRKPPEEPTAEYPDAKAEATAKNILSDLAVVLNAFAQAVAVEGHTGATDPEDYWKALATNRANRICSFLSGEKGVNPGLARPVGAPGGGAKVIVRPATLEEIFPAFDPENTGKVKKEELHYVLVAGPLGLTDAAVAGIIANVAVDPRTGKVDYWKVLKDKAKELGIPES